MATKTDTTVDIIEKLYKNCEVLDSAKESIGEHVQDYMEILAAVKGSQKEKRLASQFIARFFKHFPDLADEAMGAQLDLCEDDDVAIRKIAIKDLVNICKDNKDQIVKITDILAQLLQADDTSELHTVQQSLMALLKLDPKGALRGIYSQLTSGEESVRERCIRFLCKRLLPLDRSIIDESTEEFMIGETKKVLQDVTADEFVQMMDLLHNTSLAKTVTGKKQLVDIITKHADLDETFDPLDVPHVDRIIHCTNCALKYFNVVDSNKFTLYLINEVLPQMDKIPASTETLKFVHLELLKLYGECCSKCRFLEDKEDIIQKTIDVLFRYIPSPPVDGENASETNFEFSCLEAIIYALHQLIRVCPDVLKVDADLYKSLKLKLHFLGCHAQGYIKPLKENLRKAKEGKNGAEGADNDSDNKVNALALKKVTNISTMIKDIFHNPPRCKAEIPVSWRPTQQKSTAAEEMKAPKLKRSANGSRNDDANHSSSKQGKPREIYQPPSGKFSTRVSSSNKSSNWNGHRSSGSRSGGGGGGGRNFRQPRWRY